MRVLLTVAYDGSGFSGWQAQATGANRPKSAVIRTVQGELELALSRLYKRTVSVLGAGRTDAGVHAIGQRACFDVPDGTNIPTGNLPRALNGLLPPDIVVTLAEEVHSGFCPIIDAKAKTYEYTILNTKFPDPRLRSYVCHIPQVLDAIAMAAAAKHIEGTHDFKAFCASGSSVTTTVRTVYSCTVDRRGDTITLRVTGGGFLYNMVRIIAGTLIEVGLGKRQAEDVPLIIESRDRSKAGKTAVACGLTMIGVEYNHPAASRHPSTEGNSRATHRQN